ncbi:ABC transporter permease [Cardiobacteriaceae bacterium TAE3-ERU3]|nr:ABC transporter permease [Cardiobacteriaceae bacterium TAE3-ERU3]
MRRIDPVRAFLALLVLVAVCLPLLNFAPNRLFSGEAIYWQDALHGWQWLPAVAALLLVLGSVAVPALTLWAALALAMVVLWQVGSTSQGLAEGAGAAARATLSSSFWLLLLCALLLIVDAVRRDGKRRAGSIALLAVVLFAAVLLYSGEWSTVSLIKEYHNQASRFAAELRQHMLLVTVSFALVALLGFPLGWWLSRKQWAVAPSFAVLNIIQTIPSIALFALLLAPLAALAQRYPQLSEWGVGGIGVVPAVIALVLYTLLPLVRNTYAAFHGIDADVREAARGMGMTAWQVWCKVDVPLALPVILSGVRIVLVQAIGLAVVAGLIGAGGLGTFVWQGLGQYAMDLVLLGAIPTILLALAVDALLQWLMNVTDTGRQHA